MGAPESDRSSIFVLFFVILGGLFSFSVPQFSYLENEDDSVHFQSP